MTGTEPSAHSGNDGAPPRATNEGLGQERPLPWLLPQKIAVPDRAAGYFDRAGLADRAMPTRRRLTVLSAPGGFGKTTLLAECCRRLRDDGVPVAWVSVDDQDEPAVLDTYIAYACRSAVAGALAGPETLALPTPGEVSGEAGSRTELTIREIARLDGPFVLVFDELERLRHPETAAQLDFLLQRGPPNLHLAIACRQLPGGLNIAGAVLEGRAVILTTEDLRFSAAEVADFFDGKLSRTQLAAVMSESTGWPFAVRISRNETASGERGDARIAAEFVENWVESRLLSDLGAEDREFLLDIGLFEWMDTALLDEVLERSDSTRRIETMPVLAGLLEPVRDGAVDIWRLHPLIREHCVRRRFRETPQRFCAVHRRLADALMRRGQTVAAMRHAVEAGEPALAGEFLERAGGVRLYLREGVVQFRSADRLLGDDLAGAGPRLGLVRCLSLILAGRTEEARERYCVLARVLEGLEADESDAALELRIDHCVVRGAVALYGGERFGSALAQGYLAENARLAQSPRIDLLTRGVLEYGLCIAGNMTADFGVALHRAARARRCFVQSPFMSMYVDIQEGQAAMAEGRAQDAAALYRRAERVAKGSYVLDAEPAVICGTLSLELALECGAAGRGAVADGAPEALVTGRTPFQSYAAASGAVLELKLRYEGVEAALAVAEEILDFLGRARLPALVRYMAGLRISLLAAAGRTGEGEEAWASAGLPEEEADCLDLAGQTWREMEALSCARLRLAIGRERFEEARGFAEALRAAAAARGLRRTLMRTLALSAALERRAGEAAAAAGHLEEYLRLFAETPYAGPLIRERADCENMLLAFLETSPDPARQEAAQSLLASMEAAGDTRRPVLSAREREILQRLGNQQDRQIAAELGLTAYGVRYHIRKLFNKLGVRKRAEAVHRAREYGLIPGDF